MSKIELVISPRERDLGGFTVRRILPFSSRRMVGPFLFLDHMGPALFPPGEGLSVRPHPHIHLATVTYLFEGKIHHRDSLGSDQLIEPGAINWMTAGRGIVHSERTPPENLAAGGRISGLQCWVALPAELENTEPQFFHHPAKTLPEFSVGGVRLRLLLGSAFGKTSPVRVHSDLFYLEARMSQGTKLVLPAESRESAFYVAEGSVNAEDQTINAYSMAVVKQGESTVLEALENSRLMLLGGTNVGTRFMDWNFVSSKRENIEAARAEWAKGPGSARFPKVPGDDKEFIPLPEKPDGEH